MRRFFRMMLVALGGAVLCTLNGCSFWPFKPAPPKAVDQSLLGQHPNGVPERFFVQVMPLQVRVYRLTLPVGDFSLNEKVWRQLDEDALDSATSVLLARNGIRAGVGPQERWPAIAKLLDGPGATNQEYICRSDGRTAVPIATRQNVADQTVFFVDRDLQLQGRTFDKCDNIVRLSMGPVRDSSDMMIQVEPVVLEGTMDVTRGSQELGVVRVTSPVEETFRNLRLAARIKSSQFLAMCPANPKSDLFSVGTRFLSDTDHVPPLETVLVFVPIPDKASDNSRK